MLQINEYDDDD